MSLTLKLPGRRALSDFRLDKLLHQAHQALPAITSIRTQYWHFVKLKRALSTTEATTLQALVDLRARLGRRASGARHPSRGAAPRHGVAVGFQGDGHRAPMRPRGSGAYRARNGLPVVGCCGLAPNTSPAARPVAVDSRPHDRDRARFVGPGRDALFHEARPAPLSMVPLSGGLATLKSGESRPRPRSFGRRDRLSARLLRSHVGAIRPMSS